MRMPSLPKYGRIRRSGRSEIPPATRRRTVPRGGRCPSGRSRAGGARCGVGAAYDGFEVVSIPLPEWLSRWLPGLEREGVRAGLNWSGSHATGFDLEPKSVERTLAARQQT